ncbi:DNA polymerase epsilon subunit 4 [Cichlidogyrus casuarinus]|uniref:DNA polymerase epsilon subunit 4 n=1 Tax=Cichlidogyrus casuarinus TaxID=1844966 RepID=A0ABD2QKZ4_9PLAT
MYDTPQELLPPGQKKRDTLTPDLREKLNMVLKSSLGLTEKDGTMMPPSPKTERRVSSLTLEALMDDEEIDIHPYGRGGIYEGILYNRQEEEPIDMIALMMWVMFAGSVTAIACAIVFVAGMYLVNKNLFLRINKMDETLFNSAEGTLFRRQGSLVKKLISFVLNYVQLLSSWILFFKTMSESDNLANFPLSKIKTLMKAVPGVELVASDSVILMSMAAEDFCKRFIKDAQQVAAENQKKTISKDHVNTLVTSLPQYEFLDGLLE